ncbi:MAG TPA: hypothetical protein GXX23_03780 [Firmicutes bacterium]|nr:hypothetical protein [Candidatus Fermentithermobacillaceae bacterium]
MKERSFWDYLAMGVAAGAAIGLVVMARRRPDSVERAKMMVERTARRAMSGAQSIADQIAGRFSD